MATARATPTPELSARRFLFALLLGTLAALGVILFKLGPALSIAAVLTALLAPINRRLTRWVRGRANVSASILVVLVTLLILAPTVLLSAYVVNEVTEGATFVAETMRSDGVNGLVKKLPGPSRKLAEKAISVLPGKKLPDLGETVQEQGTKAVQAVGTVVTATWEFLFQMVMMLIALYFLLSQGKQLLDWIDEMSPLRRGQTHELMAEFRKVSRSIVLSTAATAGAQAVVGFIGYLIAKVPHPIFFAAVTFFLAFIPAVGGGFVCATAAGLLLLTGHPYMAIFLFIWAVVAVGLVDNLVQPLVMKGGVQMSGAIVFFSLIGGLAAFGAIGLLVGPFVTALFLAVLRIYWRDFAEKPKGPSAPAHA
jgi:predicted PurR-regulated permease PerM